MLRLACTHEVVFFGLQFQWLVEFQALADLEQAGRQHEVRRHIHLHAQFDLLRTAGRQFHVGVFRLAVGRAAMFHALRVGRIHGDIVERGVDE